MTILPPDYPALPEIPETILLCDITEQIALQEWARAYALACVQHAFEKRTVAAERQCNALSRQVYPDTTGS